MATITITLDEHLLDTAMAAAEKRGTSLDELIGTLLAEHEWKRIQQQGAVASLLDLARKSTAGSGPEGRTWKREDLYDRPGPRE